MDDQNELILPESVRSKVKKNTINFFLFINNAKKNIIGGKKTIKAEF